MDRTGILAGATLALLMAAGQVSAAPRAELASPSAKPLVLAQADAGDEAESEEERRRREVDAQPEEEADEGAADTAPGDGEEPAAPAQQADEPMPPAAAEPDLPADDDAVAPGEPPAEVTPPTPTEAPSTPQAEEPAPPSMAEPEVPADDEDQAAPGDLPSDATPPTPTDAPPQSQAEQPPAEQPTPPNASEPELQPDDGDGEAAPGELPADATPPTPTDAPTQPQPSQPPTEATPPPADAAPAETDDPAPPEGEPQPDDDDAAAPSTDAPVLDSQKETGEGSEGDPSAPVQQQPDESAAPPPASDAEAQQLERPVEVRSLREEEGRRIDRRELRRERREGVDVLREIGDRILLQLGDRTIVQSDDRRRIGRDATEVYYEELPRGRTRETVIRANGVQVVTIRDRYGDIVRRSRITPDGREYVLVYAEDDRRDERRDRWRDPGRDLPPLHLSIPARDYIFDAGRSSDPRAYYDFLDQPPIEPVRQLYSIDDVRYSARIRDSVRRIDLDTITFDFGSATIAENAIPHLSALADAMGQLLDENPAETFLIEGHTDAVGSDLANLALSDRRAEAIATALTGVFDVPPENLVTQGYGERFLKVKTEEPERENRRVAVRRITPLVAPVAAQR